jgi:hypothetical protein
MKTSPSTATAFDELTKLVGTVVTDSLKNTSALVQAAASLVSPVLSSKTRKQCGCSDDCGCNQASCTCGCGCKIPETCCPPRCVCAMTLAAMTGQSVVAGVRIVNQGQEQRTFSLASTPLFSGPTKADFAFSPAALTLEPGRSGFAAGSLTIPASFAKGSYQGEITVTGAYEHCVKVTLDVGCDEYQFATCEVVECERYERIRAHHWYDHFQCVEPCGPPPASTGGRVVDTAP